MTEPKEMTEEKMSMERLENKIKEVKEKILKHAKIARGLKTKSSNVSIMQQFSEKRRHHNDKIEYYKKELVQLNLMFPEGFSKTIE